MFTMSRRLVFFGVLVFVVDLVQVKTQRCVTIPTNKGTQIPGFALFYSRFMLVIVLCPMLIPFVSSLLRALALAVLW